MSLPRLSKPGLPRQMPSKHSWRDCTTVILTLKIDKSRPDSIYSFHNVANPTSECRTRVLTDSWTLSRTRCARPGGTLDADVEADLMRRIEELRRDPTPTKQVNFQRFLSRDLEHVSMTVVT